MKTSLVTRAFASILALTLLVMALLASPVARPSQAQRAPTPTPIPEQVAPPPAPPALPTPIPLNAEPAPTPIAPAPQPPADDAPPSADFGAQAALLIAWSPMSGSVLTFTTIAPSVVVTVSSNEGDLDPTTAEFIPIVNDVIQPSVPITIGSVQTVTTGSVHTLRLRADVSAYNTGDRVVFRIRKQGDPPNTWQESPQYLLRKQHLVFLPIGYTLPEPGGSACAAESGAYQLFQPSTPYFIARTRQDAWFFAHANITQTTALQVWLTNYAPSSGGQVQVYQGANCGSIALVQPIGVAPNPTVTVIVTQPKVYVRVVTVGGAPAPFNIAWRVLPGLQPGADACSAAASNAAKLDVQSFNYAVPNPPANAWFWAQNPTNQGIVQVWLTDYATTGHQLQVFSGACNALTLLRVVPLSSSVLTATVSAVPAGNVFFRVVGSSAPPPYRIAWRVLPPTENVNACSAYPLAVNTPLNWPLKNSSDFFAIHVTRTGSVRLYFTNHPINGAQLQFRSGLNVTNCTAPTLHGLATVSNGSAQLNFNATVTGTYYIRNAMTSSYPGTQQYTVRWEFGSPYGEPLFTTNPNQPFNPPYNGDICSNINVGGSCTYYWFGLDKPHPSGYNGDFDVLQILVKDATNLPPCNPGNPAQVTPSGFANNWGNVGTAATPDGSITFTFNAQGAYNIQFRAVKGGSQVWYDAKPLRVGC